MYLIENNQVIYQNPQVDDYVTQIDSDEDI